MADLRVGIITSEPLRPGMLAALRLAPTLGIDHLGTIDHVSFHDGEGIDGLITATALATLVPEASVYVGVYLLPLRHPVTVARQLSTLSQIAPGRVVFGMGIGGEDRHEVEICGIDPRTRGRRMDASLEILRGLLRGEEVSRDDAFFQIDRARILPAPVPAIPLVVGGRSNAALLRAGRFADGWIGVFNSARRFAEATARVAEVAGEAGRGEIDWQHAMEMWCCVDDERERARKHLASYMEAFYHLPFGPFERYCLFGTPEDVAEQLAPYLEAGCKTLNLIPGGLPLSRAVEGIAEVRRLLVR